MSRSRPLLGGLPQQPAAPACAAAARGHSRLAYSEIHTDEEKQTATGFRCRSVSSRPTLDLQGIYVRCRRRAVGWSSTAQLPPARLEAPTGERAALPRRSDARTGAGGAVSPAVGPPDHVPVGRRAPVPGSGGCPPGWAHVGHTVWTVSHGGATWPRGLTSSDNDPGFWDRSAYSGNTTDTASTEISRKKSARVGLIPGIRRTRRCTVPQTSLRDSPLAP